MPRILFRAGKDPRTALSPEQAASMSRLGVFGSNSGNMLFYSSVHRALSVPGAELVPDAYALEREGSHKLVDHINAEYDAVVLPLANSFRTTFLPHLDRLTTLVRRLKIPFTVVGVGAQLLLDETPDHVSDEYRSTVTAFVRAVLERSESIGVRGEFTASMLQTFGIPADRIDVIGCPSMFIHGPAGPLVRKTPALTAESRIALNYTPRVKDIDLFLDDAASRFPEAVVVPQTHRSYGLMVWGEPRATGKVNPRLPQHANHPLYLENRMRFFIDASTWVDYMRDMDFVAGTRLHGNIAGVLAGTPTLLIAHDQRTLELAEYHGIPHVLDTKLEGGFDLARAYEETDFDSFAGKQEATFERYRAFLNRNNLPTVYEPGNENPEYDAAIAAAPFPGPIETLMAEGLEGRRAVASRIAWLRQGFQADSQRRAYAYKKPFPPKLVQDAPVERRVTTATLSADVAKLQTQLDELKRQERKARVKAALPASAPKAIRKVRRLLGR